MQGWRERFAGVTLFALASSKRWAYSYEMLPRFVGYFLGIVFFGLWIVGWASDFAAEETGWSVVSFVVIPLGAVRGLLFLLRHLG
jgi:hypothetical protein